IAIFSISLSRIYLGVHYVGDVMGGIIFGLLIAIISFKAESGIINRLDKLSRSSKYLVAVILPVLLVTIAAMQESLLKEQVEIGLVMGGIGVGYLLEKERVRFAEAKNNKQRMKRAAIGVAVLGIIYLISSLLFLVNPNFVFFKYAALGFTSTYIAPWAFTKMEV
ncbi:MAG: phosphatase PAP2 family protein, partial [Candidatus Methanoperedens sp.]